MRASTALIGIVLAVTSFAAAEASNTNGWAPITYLYGTDIGVVIFNAQSVSRSALPNCATASPHRFAFNASTAAGQVMATVLLSAHAARRRVWVQGAANCSATGDIETVMYFNIED